MHDILEKTHVETLVEIKKEDQTDILYRKNLDMRSTFTIVEPVKYYASNPLPENRVKLGHVLVIPGLMKSFGILALKKEKKTFTQIHGFYLMPYYPDSVEVEAASMHFIHGIMSKVISVQKTTHLVAAGGSIKDAGKQKLYDTWLNHFWHPICAEMERKGVQCFRVPTTEHTERTSLYASESGVLCIQKIRRAHYIARIE